MSETPLAFGVNVGWSGSRHRPEGRPVTRCTRTPSGPALARAIRAVRL